MTNDFYRAFEDRYRGSRELVLTRLRCYLPFIQTLTKRFTNHSALDLGCGRGEWLEILIEHGFDALGVDLDESMLQDCRSRSLPVKRVDAITGLMSLEDSSQVLVSGFHIAEHISFDELQNLVSESFRVLKPAGLLILETPNPENIIVATRNFYLDPSHQCPIPPQLLSFVTEYQGFLRNKVVRLQESGELLEKLQPSLNEVFSGASPDYAVIAQKPAEQSILQVFDSLFDREYGLPFETLASRFNESIDVGIKQIEAKIKQAEAKAEQAGAKAEQAEAKAEQAEAFLLSVFQSRSWRMTAPLRNISTAVRWFFSGVNAWIKFKPGSRPRRVSKSLLLRLKSFVIARPKVKARVVEFLLDYPQLNELIRKLTCSVRDTHIQRQPNVNQASKKLVLNSMTPEAYSIYIKLKVAIEQRQEGNC